jgi:hypothetical protein
MEEELLMGYGKWKMLNEAACPDLSGKSRKAGENERTKKGRL